jgi:catechol 2,3-dioxygenase-like lactoylglutathione lyase family enzyme
MAEFPAPTDGIALTHFIVADDVDRSRHFYADVLGGEVVMEGEPSIVALANSWVIINVGGGPTDDKPTVTLETPPDPDRVSGFLNIRVADIASVYADWSARGAEFLTAPVDYAREKRCYIRDPDGHLIEVGESTAGAMRRPPDAWPWPDELDALTAAPGNHQRLLENDLVRVLQTHVAIGTRTPVHTHPWPSVEYVQSATDFVRRDGDGNVRLDTRAGGGLKTSQVVSGRPFPPHSLENVGEVDLRVLMIELKGRPR